MKKINILIIIMVLTCVIGISLSVVAEVVEVNVTEFLILEEPLDLIRWNKNSETFNIECSNGKRIEIDCNKSVNTPTELINQLLRERWNLKKELTYWKNKKCYRPPEKPQIVTKIVEIEVPSPEGMKGDFDGDGKITQIDINMLADGCYDKEISEFPNCKWADADDSGLVDWDDLMEVASNLEY